MSSPKFRIRTSKQFRKDVRRLKRTHRHDLQKLQDVIDILREGEPLPQRYRNHHLEGEYRGYDECHIEPDWLLIYTKENDTLVLILTRTGSHSDLFNL